MLYLGIDLGGTNIAAGIVDDKGRILRKDSTPTILSRPIEEIVGDMAELCRRLVKEEGLTMDDIAAIGLGSPGTVDNKNGVIVYSNNIPMKNIPMRKMLEEHFPGKPINLENDANAAAYGEYIVNGNNAESFTEALTPQAASLVISHSYPAASHAPAARTAAGSRMHRLLR